MLRRLVVASASLALLLPAVFGVSGCARTAECVGDDCAAGTQEDPTGNSDDGGGLPLRTSKDVDVLFVIDNSGSMAEEQAVLATSVAELIDVLEAVDANYRIGVTTTDNGNPWCAAGTTTPEGGKLVLSSCKTRLDDFLFLDVDARDFACNDICTLDAAALEILPTTTHLDPEPKPRPWLEHIEGQKNIPEGTDPAAAFACFGPQGINGCGFESPLHSMYLAFERAESASEANYGFVRDSAILAVVFVTDEVDCSYNDLWAEIFDPAGNKVFWSDPMAAFPTSALCWNAGVECSGDPSAYDTCDPVDKDVSGDVTESSVAAVLHPVDFYADKLEELEELKQQLNPSQEVIVALIAGVDSSGEPFYHDVSDTDPQFHEDYGIGPGCEAPNLLDPNAPARALPPVRLRALTDEFTPGNMFSICEPDYTPALALIADAIEAQIEPECYYQCVLDSDPDTQVIDPECTLVENLPGQSEDLAIPECLRDGDGYVIDAETQDYAMPSDSANVCFAMLVDTGGQTTDPYDDMSPECVDGHFNLEFKLPRRPGFPQQQGSVIAASCALADFPDVTCPGIGG